MVDRERIRLAVREILLAVGEDPEREGLIDTPRRVAEMYTEVFAGLDQDPLDDLRVDFEAGYDEVVMLRDIPFYSMCEHHLLPFHGSAHVAYIPNGRVVGISKIARVIETFARRPQLQERLATQVADALMDGLHARGVAIVIQAQHMCMHMRGVRKPGTKVITSVNRGLFRDSPPTRAEFFSLLQSNFGED